jgi:hypothetical protein
LIRQADAEGLGTVVYWNEVRRRHCLECRTR